MRCEMLCGEEVLLEKGLCGVNVNQCGRVAVERTHHQLFCPVPLNFYFE